jgi:copper transport protein
VSRRGAAVLALVALGAACSARPAWGHASLVTANPAPAATLGAAPTEVQLSFSEHPDARLSSVSVVGDRGTAYQAARPRTVTDDPLSLDVPVRPLGRGVYTVRWRVDSAVDGHATTGAYQFGVGVALSQAGVAATSSTRPVSSALELTARWILLLGLVALVGGGTAAAARLGGSSGAELWLAGAGWLLAVIGLIVLADAQRQNAGSSLGTLLSSPVGHALIWRAVAIGAAGAALVAAVRVPRVRRAALLIASLAALAAIIVHVANGHAAAGRWPSALTVTVQVAHFAVAGVWIGGLAALLIGIRGAPSEAKAAAVRRFSLLAAGGLVVVVITGIVRAVSELRAWDQLFSTGYGRAVLAKLALVGLIAAVAARNRRRNLPAAAVDLGPLRRTSRIELAFAAAALAVAALLGTLAPPLSGATGGIRQLAASGTDVGNTVRVRITAASNEPGANRFVARIDSERSGKPLTGASVNLLFTPLDDPGVASSSLGLSPAGAGTYIGSGANMVLDGRWGVRVLIRGAAGSVEVPLELDPVGPVQRVSIERIPGHAPTYTKLVGIAGFIRVSPNPERAGRSELSVQFFTSATEDLEPVRRVVVTLAAGNGPVRQQSVRRVVDGSYVSDVTFAAGHNEIGVVAYATFGARLRSVFDVTVPGR